MDRDLVICRCMGATAGTVRDAVDLGITDMSDVRRLTGAGMGICQGIYCRELVRSAIAEASGLDPARLRPARVREPIIPVPLDVLAEERPTSRPPDGSPARSDDLADT